MDEMEGENMAVQHKKPGRTAKGERRERAEHRPKRIVVVRLANYRDMWVDDISPGRLVAWGEITEVAS